jgi:predicted secreted protein
MKTTISILLFCALMTGLLAACGPALPGVVQIDEQNAGETVEMNLGDTLEVALEGNITTGYNWVPTLQAPVLLEQVGEPEMTPESDQLGAPGKIVLQFKAVASGETILHLDYKQPWDDETAPEETFEVIVVVK